jgi:hypothetical protein
MALNRADGLPGGDDRLGPSGRSIRADAFSAKTVEDGLVQPERQVRVAAAAGPTDAWLMPRLGMSFRPAFASIRDPVVKLGGQPVWLDEPFWPVSQSFGTPMTFVGQFPIPGPKLRLTYLFVTQDDLATAETYDRSRRECPCRATRRPSASLRSRKCDGRRPLPLAARRDVGRDRTRRIPCRSVVA